MYLANRGLNLKTVLITGAAGTIGQILLSRLAGSYNLKGLDRFAGPGVTDIANIADFPDLLPHLAGVDVVIHLAGNAGSGPWEVILESNIVGVRHTFEAARLQGVSRVIFASTYLVTYVYDEEPYASVIAGGARPPDFQPISPRSLLRPAGEYGASKAFGEALGRFYADKYGLSVLCLRFCHVGKVEGARYPRELRHDDLEQMIRRCIDVPDLRFGIYYCISAHKQSVWDLSDGERDLGYRPVEDGM
ncbi:MAG: NAD(P)-dependent oxidoreductase [Chloroflexi bacterium]|nr:NAD(P)-dependent oxidoreductase [Chloroflexota bacterium]